MGNEWMNLLVSLHVESQVIRPGKAPFTMTALEWFGSGMLPKVSGQFIRSCKSPFTSFPWTLVWFLSCNISFQFHSHTISFQCRFHSILFALGLHFRFRTFWFDEKKKKGKEWISKKIECLCEKGTKWKKEWKQRRVKAEKSESRGVNHGWNSG